MASLPWAAARPSISSKASRLRGTRRPAAKLCRDRRRGRSHHLPHGPVIAVPTTAGTGSEVGREAILILDNGREVGVISPFVVPKVAICAPALTVGLPPR